MLSIVHIKPKSVISACFTLVLAIAFIAPVYHCHDLSMSHHHVAYDDHDAAIGTVDEDMDRNLSDSHSHIGPHLHFIKDINISGKTYDFQNRLKKTPVSMECSSSAHAEEFKRSEREIQIVIPKHSFSRDLSGLSPPIA
jgi:hypothetical protein